MRKVHQSYIECPTEAWVVAHGGRCYKELEVRNGFIEMVRCPDCKKGARWFNTEDSYRQHWNSVHRQSEALPSEGHLDGGMSEASLPQQIHCVICISVFPDALKCGLLQAGCEPWRAVGSRTKQMCHARGTFECRFDRSTYVPSDCFSMIF